MPFTSEPSPRTRGTFLRPAFLDTISAADAVVFALVTFGPGMVMSLPSIVWDVDEPLVSDASQLLVAMAALAVSALLVGQWLVVGEIVPFLALPDDPPAVPSHDWWKRLPMSLELLGLIWLIVTVMLIMDVSWHGWADPARWAQTAASLLLAANIFAAATGVFAFAPNAAPVIVVAWVGAGHFQGWLDVRGWPAWYPVTKELLLFPTRAILDVWNARAPSDVIWWRALHAALYPLIVLAVAGWTTRAARRGHQEARSPAEV
jgi:hypothetical protein